MTFSETNGEFKILHTSHKKALNYINWGCVILQFYRKISSKIPLLVQVFSQLQSNCKLFQQIITVFINWHMQFNNSKHCTISAKIYCENI